MPGQQQGEDSQSSHLSRWAWSELTSLSTTNCPSEKMCAVRAGVGLG